MTMTEEDEDEDAEDEVAEDEAEEAASEPTHQVLPTDSGSQQGSSDPSQCQVGHGLEGFRRGYDWCLKVCETYDFCNKYILY